MQPRVHTPRSQGTSETTLRLQIESTQSDLDNHEAPISQEAHHGGGIVARFRFAAELLNLIRQFASHSG